MNKQTRIIEIKSKLTELQLRKLRLNIAGQVLKLDPASLVYLHDKGEK